MDMLRMLTVLWVLIPYLAYASNPLYEKEELQIPKKPSAPPLLIQKSPRLIPHCERFFLFEGKKIECDSNLGRDAERLRAIMQDVPNAIAELDTYQDNLKKVQVAAYVGTAGLLAVLLSGFFGGEKFEPGSGRIKLGGYIFLGGVGIAANSFIYGLSVLKTNEAHLSNAVNNYNAAHPDRPIELQFSTQVNF